RSAGWVGPAQPGPGAAAPGQRRLRRPGARRTDRVARIYYQKLPLLAGKVPLLLDPMLATGGSAVQAVDLIREAGGVGTRMICVVAAPEGVRALHERHPEVEGFTAALDRGLNDRGFIMSGLAACGDRLFGTV